MMNVLWVIVMEKKDGTFELIKNDKGEVEAFEDIGLAKKKQANIACSSVSESKDGNKFHVMEYVCTFYSSGIGRYVSDKGNTKVRHDKD